MSAPTPLRMLWPALASLLVLALLWSVHTLGFRPLAARYRHQLADAGSIGASLDPSLAAAPLPPRVLDVMRRNSVSHAEAARLTDSGTLATDLVRRISEAAGSCGIEVAASQPGTTTQAAGALEVRAGLKLRCRYAQLVELLGDLSEERMLYRIEQLSLNPLPDGRVDVDLEVARTLVLRQARAK